MRGKERELLPDPVIQRNTPQSHLAGPVARRGLVD